MRKKVAIIQSAYIPWKGYFDIIHDADVFIFYDDVQFTTRDWRSRNRIKTGAGLTWLSIPAGSGRNRQICEVELENDRWQVKHWDTFRHWYSRAAYFKKYKQAFKEVYLGQSWRSLSELNQYLIRLISVEFLGIRAQFIDSRQLGVAGSKLDRLLELLRKVEATNYISGPAAKAYIDPKCFEDAGIQLTYKDYSGYPEYPQFHPPFEHGVSIIDLLFHVGSEAPYYIWGWRA